MNALFPIVMIAFYFLCAFLLIVGAGTLLFRVILRNKGQDSPGPQKFRKELALAIMCGAFILFLVGLLYWFARF